MPTHGVCVYACCKYVAMHPCTWYVNKLLSGLFSNECMGGREGGAGQQGWCNNCWVSTL